MAYSQAQRRATEKYDTKTYDRVVFKLHKGNKAILEAKAASEGLSVNAYILRLLKREIPDIN